MKYMKIFLIVIVVVSFMGIDAMAQPKFINASAMGAVTFRVAKGLEIIVSPDVVFPDPSRIIQRGEIQTYPNAGMSLISAFYTIKGEPGFDIDVQHNGNGTNTKYPGGGGLKISAIWYTSTNGVSGTLSNGKNITSSGIHPLTLSKAGRVFIKMDIIRAEAELNAELGEHIIEFTLTASYHI